MLSITFNNKHTVTHTDHHIKFNLDFNHLCDIIYVIICDTSFVQPNILIKHTPTDCSTTEVKLMA